MDDTRAQRSAPALWTTRGWDVEWSPLCPDTSSSQRNDSALCHRASRRGIWYCLAGNGLSLAGQEGRAGWQTEPGQAPCLQCREPTDTRSRLSSSLTPASKRPLAEGPGNPSLPRQTLLTDIQNCVLLNLPYCVLFQNTHTVICKKKTVELLKKWINLTLLADYCTVTCVGGYRWAYKSYF